MICKLFMMRDPKHEGESEGQGCTYSDLKVSKEFKEISDSPSGY